MPDRLLLPIGLAFAFGVQHNLRLQRILQAVHPRSRHTQLCTCSRAERAKGPKKGRTRRSEAYFGMHWHWLQCIPQDQHASSVRLRPDRQHVSPPAAHPDPFAVATVSTARGFDSRLAAAAVRADNSVRLRKGTARVCLCVHESVCACMCKVRVRVHVCMRVHRCLPAHYA